METLNRNHFIDVLKGICIIIVVFTHASWPDAQRLKLLFPFWIDMEYLSLCLCPVMFIQNRFKRME